MSRRFRKPSSASDSKSSLPPAPISRLLSAASRPGARRLRGAAERKALAETARS